MPQVGWGQALDKTVRGGWVLFRGTRGAVREAPNVTGH